MFLEDAMNARSLLVSLLAFVAAALAEGTSFSNDPYLAYRPPFARSLPVQIMLTGVVLTLVAVLFIHLMFTAQYHWPLAPVNYVLQLSGVTTLLISLIATIHVVLSATFAESEKWPYMLSYIAVNVPPLDLDTNTEGWSIAERATWLVMNASTSGLIQITHIQFLTLLYPSRLEGRLIFTLLGPLAVVAAIMQLLPISGSSAVNNVASAVRNVCNATLSLLFTIALFIWGLLVNRKQAWRTDGGTAVFGCAALSLAVVSTALNFLYVHKEEEFVWLPGLMWAVVLWQSFLGWWWWVGAGSGGGFASEDENMEEKLRREAKRESRRKEARERRKETKIKAQRVWKGVAGAFAPSLAHSTSAQSRDPSLVQTRSRTALARSSSGSVRSGPTSTSQVEHEHERSEPSDTAGERTPQRQGTNNTSEPASEPDADSVSLASRATSMTVTSALTYSTLPRLLPAVVHRWYTSLRRAHNAAARQQAAERVERIRELGRAREGPGAGGYGQSSFGIGVGVGSAGAGGVGAGVDGGVVEVDGWGWGWDGFGWRRRRGNVGQVEMERVWAKERSLSRSRARAREAESGYEMEMRTYERGERQRRRCQERRREQGDLEEEEEEEEDGDMYVSEGEGDRDADFDADDDDTPSRRRQQRRTDHEPSVSSTTSQPRRRSQDRNRPRTQNTTTALPLPPPAAAATRPRSMWWWGPLRRWRLQDSTIY